MATTFDATTSSTNSTTFYAVDQWSVFQVEGTFVGEIALQARIPTTGTNWENIHGFDRPGSAPILTPDPGLEYRMFAELKSGTAKAYFGA